MDARLTFENGATLDVRLGEDAAVTVPLDGDVDGDGRVDVEIALALDSTFRDLWVYDARAGFAYTGGFGRVRVKDLTGQVLAQKRVGPAFEDQCAPKVSGQRIPIQCLVSQGSEVYTYRPSGFADAVLLGGLDLTGP